MNDADAADLWDDYAADPGPQRRNALVVAYQPLVKKTAYTVLRRLPSHSDVDDLISHGQFGLITAISRFEPGRGNKFETYAAPRIKGAMLDGLRAADWAPRRVRTAMRAIDTAADELGAGIGARPSMAAIAALIGTAESDLVSAQAEAGASSLGSLDGAGFADSGDWAEYEDTAESDYALSAELAIVADALAGAIASLPPAGQAIIGMYYKDDLRMKQIGALLGSGESRACAVHARSLLLLRERLPLTRR